MVGVVLQNLWVVIAKGLLQYGYSHPAGLHPLCRMTREQVIAPGYGPSYLLEVGSHKEAS